MINPEQKIRFQRKGTMYYKRVYTRSYYNIIYS